MAATNRQIRQIIEANLGTSYSTSEWDDFIVDPTNGVLYAAETYQGEINNPYELYYAQKMFITYNITIDGAPGHTVNLDSANTEDTIVCSAEKDGEVVDSATNPELFVWKSTDDGTHFTFDDTTGVVTNVSGTGTGYINVYCPSLNPYQDDGDASIIEINYTDA